MRLRDQLSQARSQPAASQSGFVGTREAHGVISLTPRALKQIERQLVEGPPEPDEGEIDDKTGAPMCRGKDTCQLEVCSMGIRAHGIRTGRSDEAPIKMATGRHDNLALMDEAAQEAVLQHANAIYRANTQPPEVTTADALRALAAAVNRQP